MRRELEVRGELILDVLHEVLQVAMGWEDRHLHRFWRGPHRGTSRALAAQAVRGE